MYLRTIHSLRTLRDKTVLLRVDYNVSLGANGKVDPWEEHRIDATLPTIELLLKRGAQVVLLAHLGRPEGKVVAKLRLKPVARRLQQLLNHNAPQPPLILRGGAYVITSNVTLLENLRFDAREEKDDTKFAKALASLGDIYVNDAFAVSHRKNASVHAITKYLPSYAGLLMEKEISALSAIIDHPHHPLLVIMGGAKVSTKIGLIRKYLQRVDAVLLGGGIANTFLAAQGQDIGKSLYEPHMVGVARQLLRSKKILLPVDVVWSRNQMLDIGPRTRHVYKKLLQHARSIVWNGPVGLIEELRFAKGTNAIIEAVIRNKRARSIIGGGETITAFRQYTKKTTPYNLRPTPSNIFLSTGGGAMLEFLERGTLPGIKPLIIIR